MKTLMTIKNLTPAAELMLKRIRKSKQSLVYYDLSDAEKHTVNALIKAGFITRVAPSGMFVKLNSQ